MKNLKLKLTLAFAARSPRRRRLPDRRQQLPAHARSERAARRLRRATGDHRLQRQQGYLDRLPQLLRPAYWSGDIFAYQVDKTGTSPPTNCGKVLRSTCKLKTSIRAG